MPEKILLLKLSFLSTEVRKVLMNIGSENTTTIWQRGQLYWPNWKFRQMALKNFQATFLLGFPCLDIVRHHQSRSVKFIFQIWWNYTSPKSSSETNSAGNYIFKVNNKNTRTRSEICSKLTINTPERCQWRHSSVLIVNFKHISHLALVFLLLTFSR